MLATTIEVWLQKKQKRKEKRCDNHDP